MNSRGLRILWVLFLGIWIPGAFMSFLYEYSLGRLVIELSSFSSVFLVFLVFVVPLLVHFLPAYF